VIDTYKHDEYAIDTMRCIQPLKHAQCHQVGYPKCSNNSNNLLPIVAKRDICNQEVSNHNEFMKPHDMHPEDNAINVMIKMDEKHKASIIYKNNTETSLQIMIIGHFEYKQQCIVWGAGYNNQNGSDKGQ